MMILKICLGGGAVIAAVAFSVYGPWRRKMILPAAALIIGAVYMALAIAMTTD